MSDGRWETQVAVFGALTAATPAIAGGRIFAPAVAGYGTFPYVEIGESDAVPADTSGSASPVKRGQDETITIHVWDRSTSQKTVKTIISQIRDALHDVALTVTGQARAHSQIRSDRVFRDPDGTTWHGVVECRVLHHD